MSVLDWINLWLFYFFRFSDFPTCCRKFLLFFGKTNSVGKILCHQFWPYKLDEVPKRQRWYLIRGDEGSFDQTRYLEVSDLTNIFIILIKLFNLYRVLECKKKSLLWAGSSGCLERTFCLAVQVVWEKQQSTLTCCSVFLFSLVAKLIRKCGPREEEFLVDRGNGGVGGWCRKRQVVAFKTWCLSHFPTQQETSKPCGTGDQVQANSPLAPLLFSFI